MMPPVEGPCGIEEGMEMERSRSLFRVEEREEPEEYRDP
jgi:hypothetical protein